MPLPVGSIAPDFRTKNQRGEAVSLAGWRGKHIVLFFYPRDFSPVCTREVCGFRDIYDELQRAGAEVVGVSADSGERHLAFADKHAVPYHLVADENHAISTQYQAFSSLFGMMERTRRITYVIDPGGKIAAVFQGELSSETHLNGVRKALFLPNGGPVR